MFNQYNENSTSLSVIFQIDFKILLFVFKSPQYICNILKKFF